MKEQKRMRIVPVITRGSSPSVSRNDFETMLLESDRGIRRFHIGEEVTGVVVRVEKEVAYLDLGGKSEGILQLAEAQRAATGDKTAPAAAAGEAPPRVQVGDRITAFVVSIEGETVRLASRIGRSRDNTGMLQQAFDGNIPVTGRVVAVNKGGYEVDLGGARGFCPHSQMDIRFVEKPEIYLEQELEFRISEIREEDEGRHVNVVVSRRSILEEQEAKKREQTLTVLKEGADLTGRVTNLRPFGAFVDLGGMEGLIHISELSHRRVDDPAELLKVGQEVQVRVLAIEEGGRRISLSMKALEQDPWDGIEERYPIGTQLTGRVVRLQPFGAFVNLAPGVDGLLHISVLSPGKRISHPKDVVKEGQSLEVVVTGVDEARQRISLELGGAEYRKAATEAAMLPEVGSLITGTVEKVERFGVFVKIGPGRTGLIPRSELDIPEDREPRTLFPKGMELKVKLIEVDEDRGRYTLSQRAVRVEEERSTIESFVHNSGSGTGSGGSTGMGTLGDLLRAKHQKPSKK